MRNGPVFDPPQSGTRRAIKIQHPRPLHQEWKCRNWLANSQSLSAAMRGLGVQRQRTFIKRVQNPDLTGMKCGSRETHINIASSIGQDLHLAIDSATVSSRTICQGKIAVHESILGSAVPFFV